MGFRRSTRTYAPRFGDCRAPAKRLARLAAGEHLALPQSVVGYLDRLRDLGVDERYVEIERVEAAYVSSSLLAAKLELLDLPDGHLRHDAGTISAIESAVSELDPQLVVTHFPQGNGFGHQDHAVLAHATTNVVLRKHASATLLYAEPPTSAHGFAPNFFVDITDHFALKVDAIRHHGSEGGKHFMEPSLVEQRARWWAAQALGELATDSRRFEAFQLAKGMVLTPRPSHQG